MAKISDLLAQGRTISFEFFPPKTPVGVENLKQAVAELAPSSPSFMSVTYGAGGSTRDLTAELVIDINRENDFPVMAHLTCMGHTHDQVKELLDQYAESGVENILALGGDPPADGSDPGGDFAYACELVELIRGHGADFSIGVAAQPELHPRSTDRGESTGDGWPRSWPWPTSASPSFFFDPNDYLLMVEELADLGCHTPILPGVMLFRNLGGPGPDVRDEQSNCRPTSSNAWRGPATTRPGARHRRRRRHPAQRATARRRRSRPPPLCPEPGRRRPAGARRAEAVGVASEPYGREDHCSR